MQNIPDLSHLINLPLHIFLFLNYVASEAGPFLVKQIFKNPLDGNGEVFFEGASASVAALQTRSTESCCYWLAVGA